MFFSKNIKGVSLTNKTLYLKDEICLKESDFLAIIGADGLLRSNYLYLLSGLLKLEYGELTLFGKSIVSSDYETIKKIRTRTGFVFDEGGLISNISIYDNMVLPLRYHFKTFSKKYLFKRIDRYLKNFGIYDYKDLRPGEIDKEKYKLSLYCRSLLLNPKILFINEPILFLGTNHRKYIIDYLFSMQYNNKKIIISTFADIEVAYKMANKFIILSKDNLYKYYSNKEDIIDDIQNDLYIRELFIGCGV